MKYKYDVFISYSRKDYIDENKNIIPDNAISAITEALEKNGISFWIDREGIYSGQEFENIIIDAIDSSRVFLFVSSFHSNESKWTKSEIWQAFDSDKYIIPFKIDDCDYHKNLKFKLRPIDFISYCNSKEEALTELVRSIDNYKKELAEHQLKEQQESQREEINRKIEAFKDDYSLLTQRQDAILKDIHDNFALLGIKTKKCPVCEQSVDLSSSYCEHCGWQFHPLRFNDDEIAQEVDRKRLSLVRANWKIINSAVTSKNEFQALNNEIYDLKESLKAAEDEKGKNEKTIAELKQEMDQLIVQLTEFKLNNEELTKKHKALSEQYNAVEKELTDIRDRETKSISTGKQQDNLIDKTWIKEHIFPLCYNTIEIKNIFEIKKIGTILSRKLDERIDFKELIALMSFYGVDIDILDLKKCQDEDDVARVVILAAKSKNNDQSQSVISKVNEFLSDTFG